MAWPAVENSDLNISLINLETCKKGKKGCGISYNAFENLLLKWFKAFNYSCSPPRLVRHQTFFSELRS